MQIKFRKEAPNFSKFEWPRGTLICHVPKYAACGLRYFAKRNETKRNGILRNGTLRNGILRNGILRNGTLRNGILRNGILRKGTLRNAHFARSTIPEVACKQAHLVRYSCEYLGGGAAVCKSATEASQ